MLEATIRMSAGWPQFHVRPGDEVLLSGTDCPHRVDAVDGRILSLTTILDGGFAECGGLQVDVSRVAQVLRRGES